MLLILLVAVSSLHSVQAAQDNKKNVTATINQLLLDEGTDVRPTPVPPVPTPPLGTAASVSQYGITWYFDKAYPIGKFANGDWWVRGPARITNITPAFGGGRNGWQVNPAPGNAGQGFDDRVWRWNYDSSLVPSLPYTANAGDSILKAVSGDGKCTPTDDPKTHPCHLDTVAVLTVLGEIPENNGATVFRPPFVSNTQKKLYSLSALRTDLLPSLAPVADAPSLEEVRKHFARPQIDYSSSFIGRYLHPAKNMRQYGSSIAIETNEAALRLMLNDPLADKMPALIAYVQAGIDFYHMLDAGVNWKPNGGHFVGRKLPVVFAATLLNDPAMKAAIAASAGDTFSEDGHTYLGKNNVALFGKKGSESSYWRRINENKGSRDDRDPYGYVDGGGDEIGGAYQVCCTSNAYKGAALAAHLLPDGKQTWSHDAFFSYVDRWVTQGVWASPDPCKHQTPASFTGQCVPGTGRYLSKHGTNADSGGYSSGFVNNMWRAYRAP